MLGLLTAAEHLSHSSFGKRLVLLYYINYFFSGFAGSASQLAHFIGYYGEAATMFTSAGSLNSNLLACRMPKWIRMALMRSCSDSATELHSS